jgi:hypothetical protein
MKYPFTESEFTISIKSSNSVYLGRSERGRFEIKAVTYVIATPDEVYSALYDQRDLWDSYLTNASKKNENSIDLVYHSTDGQSFSESLKISTINDKGLIFI